MTSLVEHVSRYGSPRYLSPIRRITRAVSCLISEIFLLKMACSSRFRIGGFGEILEPTTGGAGEQFGFALVDKVEVEDDDEDDDDEEDEEEDAFPFSFFGAAFATFVVFGAI